MAAPNDRYPLQIDGTVTARPITTNPSLREPLFASKDVKVSDKNLIVNFVSAALAGIGWLVSSTILILLNKYIMHHYNFRFPATVALLEMSASTLSMYLCSQMFPTSGGNVLVYDRSTVLLRVLPLSALMASTLVLGNIGYLHLSISFVQIIKTLAAAMTTIVLVGLQLEQVTAWLALAMFMSVGGVWLACWGGAGWVVAGLVAMVLAVVAEAVRIAFTVNLLGSGNPMSGLPPLSMLSMAACVWLVFCVLLFEAPRLLAEEGLAIVQMYPVPFTAAIFMAFSLTAFACLVLQLSSQGMLRMLGTGKNLMLVGVGVVYLREAVGHLQLLGYAISLSGFLLHYYSKRRQSAQAGLSAVPREPGSPPPTNVLKSKASSNDMQL